MIDFLFEIGISNAVISLAISIVALAVGKLFNRPHLAYLLWLFVLVKLLMPALVSVPIPMAQNPAQQDPVAAVSMTDKVVAAPPLPVATTAKSIATVPSINFAIIQSTFRIYFPVVWGFGILVALCWSLIRVIRFNRLLRFGSETAPKDVIEMTEGLSQILNLKRLPKVFTTSAEITPMVWWIGGKVRIYLPSVLVKNMEPEEMRLVLAHELAHVKRRDYLVRWIEWSAAVLFWWNPIVWWAQRNLRAYEEICCDALIISSFNPEPHQYASSLLSAVEQFAGTAVRPPSMASEVNSGGYLVRRIHMILSKENKFTVSRKLQILVLFVAAFVLPLGFANAQQTEVDQEVKQARQKLEAEVKAGKKSEKEAMVEMAALKNELVLRRGAEKLERAVADRKISPEDAAAKLADLKRRSAERAKRAVEMEFAAKELEKSVEAGKMSKDEANRKMLEMQLQYQLERRNSDFKRMADELKAAVSTNRISAIEAEAKMMALKQKYSAKEKSDAMKIAAEKLEYALEKGLISRDKAKKKMQELQLRYVEQKRNTQLKKAADKLKAMVEANEISAAEAEKKMQALKQNYSKTQSEYRAQAAAEKLQYALEAGRISQEEAKIKLEKLKLSYSFQKKKAELDRAAAKLKAAVKAGELMVEEAKEKMKELQKELQESNN